MQVKDKIITMHIDIEDRRATYREAPEKLVCGNPFNLIFSFDEEWDDFADFVKKARLVFWHNGRNEHIVIEFTGDTCPVPALFDVKNITVGVFIDDEICTTTGAFIECEKSIRCGHSTCVFGADAIDNINKALKGEKGDKGDKGDPYELTDDDKNDIVEAVLNALPNGDEVLY